MQLPPILAHGDLRILYVIVVILGTAIVSGVVSVVSAAKQTRGVPSRLAVISGAAAIFFSVALLLLFGWPRDFWEISTLALVSPLALGAIGIFLTLSRRGKT
ncbi:MAG TPA: hypothetical protein VHO24_18365 [Opitutaceae bacterium]|nr:hypothetical protein [Opitutaceae bacterium]